MVAKPRGQVVVGLENTTSFIRAVRSGKLHAVARPVTRGRTTQVWQAWIRDEQDQLVAQGQVRLLCVDKDKALG
jgi:1,4-dihydroxy-2-naphthoyl-CoA hydrolase